MASRALDQWTTTRALELDELVAAHHAVGGTGRGRRYTTRQLNHAYLLAVAAQFQGFCRDLHSEAADEIVAVVEPAALAVQMRVLLTSNRQLDKGNATPGALGTDFQLLGLRLWPELYAGDQRNERRNAKLEELNQWRNAIAHDDFTKIADGSVLVLKTVKDLRSACSGVARSMDSAVSRYVRLIVGKPPW
jgi:hypothetical protein